MATQAFYYPLLFLTPDFEELAVEAGGFLLSKRQWQTSTFDLATLATRHKLHLPYQVMDVFLSRCNLEVAVVDCDEVEAATEKLQNLRLALYAEGVSPF